MVATSRTVGKAENSSGFWIHKPTIRMSTESAIDSARPKSIIVAGTGRKKRQRMRTMPTAKPMSLPPRPAGAVGIAVTDMFGRSLLRRRGSCGAERRVGGEACARIEGRFHGAALARMKKRRQLILIACLTADFVPV